MKARFFRIPFNIIVPSSPVTCKHYIWFRFSEQSLAHTSHRILYAPPVPSYLIWSKYWPRSTKHIADMSEGCPYGTASKLDMQTKSQLRTASEETNKMYITYTSLCLLNWYGVVRTRRFHDSVVDDSVLLSVSSKSRESIIQWHGVSRRSFETSGTIT